MTKPHEEHKTGHCALICPRWVCESGIAWSLLTKWPDIGSFESVDTPFVATCWRRSMETIIAPRFVPLEIFSIDELHTVRLGVFKNFVVFVFNAAIKNDIFEVRSASLAARPQMSVERLEADLLAWYRRDRVANPDRPQYPLQNFTVGTLGTRGAPGSLSTLAAETRTLVYYATDLVRPLN